MQKRIITVLFFLILILPSRLGSAQTLKTFSRDSIQYLEEIKNLLNQSAYKKESKEFFDIFPSYWLSDQLTVEQRKNIYDISDALLSKKARAYPDFYTYFNTLLLFAEKNLPAPNYQNWEKGLLQLVGNKKVRLKAIQDYLDQTTKLLRENIIFESYSTRWKCSSSNYKWTYDEQVAIEFEETNLTCYAQRDSSDIQNTTGTYYPLENIWKGNHGKVTWQRAGFSPDEVYAEFPKYEINMAHSYFSVDTAIFTNPNYFKQPLLGSFEDKVMKVKNSSSAMYPRFESFHKRIDIKNLYPNVDYNGGVAIHGAKFIGKGSPEEMARIYISRHDSLFMTASSEYFTIRKDRIVGNNTEVSLNLDTLSIYHPGLLFKYVVDNQEVNLVRDGEGLSKSPYFDNYHNVIMDFEMLTWKMGENKMHFRMMKGASIQQASFESSNFFSAYRYGKLQAMDKVNPLVGLLKCSEYLYVTTFTAKEYANYMKLPENQIRQQLMGLSFMGFISYDRNTDEVTIRQRLYDYIKAAIGKQDYDVINFASKTPSSQDNAVLDLENYNLKINGVQQIAVSDSQNVVIYPKNQEIILKKNRDFIFDGKIRAGLFDLYGSDFAFSYNDFKVDLHNIDSLRISVFYDDVDYYGKRKAIQIDNVIEMITGNLLIDAPDNKSGLISNPNYPIFNSTSDSYVYYNRPSIQNGAYKREKFYFKMDPYTINNINELNKEDINFAGIFVSDSIFPTFQETLALQEDYSLGFKTQTPPEGYPVYGKGTYHQNIHLSNKGLLGEGTLDYLASTTESKDFTFLPEKMLAQAETFHLKGTQSPVSNPEVLGENVYAEWLPKEDEYLVKSQSTPLQMFANQATLAGTIKLQPQGVAGWGSMDFENAKLKSDYFTYSNTDINADISDFELKGQTEELLALQTFKVKSNIDFTHRKGEFISTEANSFARFPANQYICYMKNFTWQMDEDHIDFGIGNQELLAQAWQQNTMDALPISAHNRFVSTHFQQDSLSFEAPYARYSMEEQKIYAKYVKQIPVADAIVYPNKGDVTIEPKALLQTLREAKVVADTTNHYHTLYDAIVNIHGKNSFSGAAKYDYIDANKRAQVIQFDVIDVDSTGQTYAMGELQQDQSFTLSPDFDYKGRVQLNAREPFLTFDGAAHIHNECEQVGYDWLRFNAAIDPNDILIPVSKEPENDEQLNVYNSVFLTNDSTRIYSAFLSKRDFYTDNVLLSADGFLTFNKQKKAYIIASKEKLKNPDLTGRQITLYQNECNLEAEGPVNLGSELGQIRQVSSGSIKHDLNEDKVTLNLMLGLDFFFSDAAIKIMEEKFKAAELKESKQSPKEFTKKLAEILGEQAASKALMQMDAKGHFKNLPDKLQHTIFFNNLNLVWNKEEKTYQSIGEIGIGNINKTQVNKAVNGVVEIEKRRSGNRLTMYLEIDKANWFFFEYHHGVMFALSSDEKFNEIIHELKPDKRNMKKEDKIGKDEYSFILSPRSKKTKFKNRFNL